jgi:hypothetical protein
LFDLQLQKLEAGRDRVTLLSPGGTVRHGVGARRMLNHPAEAIQTTARTPCISPGLSTRFHVDGPCHGRTLDQM